MDATFQQQGATRSDVATEPVDKSPVMTEPIPIQMVDEGHSWLVAGHVIAQQRIFRGDVGRVGENQFESSIERIEMTAGSQLDPLFEAMSLEVAGGDRERWFGDLDSHCTQIWPLLGQRDRHRRRPDADLCDPR